MSAGEGKGDRGQLFADRAGRLACEGGAEGKGCVCHMSGRAGASRGGCMNRGWESVKEKEEGNDRESKGIQPGKTVWVH